MPVHDDCTVHALGRLYRQVHFLYLEPTSRTLSMTSIRNTVSAARSPLLFILAIISCSSAEVTRRALQNHRYAAGLPRLTGEEKEDRRKVRRFLNTSRDLSFCTAAIQAGGAVFMGVSLLARWRVGIVWSDGVFPVSCVCPSALSADHWQICTAAQSMCYVPFGIAFFNRWIYAPAARYVARAWPRIGRSLERRTDQDV